MNMPSDRRDRTYGWYKGYKTIHENSNTGYRHIGFDKKGKLVIQTHSSAILYRMLDTLARQEAYNRPGQD